MRLKDNPFHQAETSSRSRLQAQRPETVGGSNEISDLGPVIRIRGQSMQAHLCSHQHGWEERGFSGCRDLCHQKHTLYTRGHIRCAVASTSQQRTCSPCLAVGGKGPSLISVRTAAVIRSICRDGMKISSGLGKGFQSNHTFIDYYKASQTPYGTWALWMVIMKDSQEMLGLDLNGRFVPMRQFYSETFLVCSSTTT